MLDRGAPHQRAVVLLMMKPDILQKSGRGTITAPSNAVNIIHIMKYISHYCAGDGAAFEVAAHSTSPYVARNNFPKALAKSQRFDEGIGMTKNIPAEPEDLLLLTSAIVRAYVSHNAVSAPDLPALIKQTHTALKTLGDEAPAAPEAEQKPAVPVKKSVTPDFIICLEDGKEFRSLKRHLRTAFAMTPDEYRAKWNLPSDYPMVAPNYSATRSNLAKNFGLGRKAL